jgi:hypothetical protein
MAVLSDGVTIGVVLLLLFGALFFYLWLRIQQVEKRNVLLENILLDLKLTTESTMGEFPEPAPAATKTVPVESPVELAEETASEDISSDYLSELTPSSPKKEAEVEAEDYTSALDEIHEASAPEPPVVAAVMPPSSSRTGSSYESMTLKDLKSLAKTRKVSGVGSLTRAQLIQSLKEKDDQASSLWGSTPIAEEGVLDNVVESAGEVASE